MDLSGCTPAVVCLLPGANMAVPVASLCSNAAAPAAIHALETCDWAFEHVQKATADGATEHALLLNIDGRCGPRWPVV